jgi:uroporphyrin-III C-methyltransferase
MNTVLTYHKQPKLTLVGAGPGDAELITLKAVRVLKSADIVLYDALVSEEILDHIPTGTPALSVGKRAGAHAYSQEEINELCVEFAFLYGHVVRLKGGDPFVFGRGIEEIEFAEKNGVTTEVIPGISSAMAVPAALNIPVTSRGLSESFWVVTGTTKDGSVSGDILLAAQSTATVIVLMGLNKLSEITNIFQSVGKQDVPVAVIQNGTLKSQRSVLGTVSNIVERTKMEKIESPAIIVIGEVVRHASSIKKLETQVLNQISSYQ